MKIKGVAAVVLAMGAASFSFGENTYWKHGTDGIWSNAENWTVGLPAAGSEARIQGGKPGPKITAGDSIECSKLLVAWGGGKQNTLWVESGSLNIESSVSLGYMDSDCGTLIMSGGKVECGSVFHIGFKGEGVWKMTGGEAVVGGHLSIAHAAGSKGHLQLDGGSVVVYGKLWLSKGLSGEPGGGDASIDITKGTLILLGDQTQDVEALINDGVITANGGEDPTLYVKVEYKEGETVLSVDKY